MDNAYKTSVAMPKVIFKGGLIFILKLANQQV